MSNENKNASNAEQSDKNAVKFIYDEKTEWNWNEINMNSKTKNKTNVNQRSLVDRICDKIWYGLENTIKFTVVTIPTFVGQSVIYVFENVSRVFRVDIGIFNAEKLELATTIAKQREELAMLRIENKELDEDNYLLVAANSELRQAGLDMHDEIVTLYGENAYLALSWRKAESRSAAKLSLDYEEASKYLSVRQRRSLQEDVPTQYPVIRRYSEWSDANWEKICKQDAKKDPQRGSSKVSSTKKKAAKKKSKG